MEYFKCDVFNLRFSSWSSLFLIYFDSGLIFDRAAMSWNLRLMQRLCVCSKEFEMIRHAHAFYELIILN